MRILIATHNSGKKREYLELLGPLQATILFPDDLDLQLSVQEDGMTYADNARKKARRYASASGVLTVADDSGLEVDALGGTPGIHSARYAAGSDADRVDALLHDLRGVPWEARTARFRCVLAVVTRTQAVYESQGICEGVISFEPHGDGGFGYDPVFYVPDHACTMAQLSREEKNRISHRAQAVEAALPVLERIVEGRGTSFHEGGTIQS